MLDKVKGSVQEALLTEEMVPGTDRLRVTLDVGAGTLNFEWFQGEKLRARSVLRPHPSPGTCLTLETTLEERTYHDYCTSHGSSVRALVNRIKKFFRVPYHLVELGFFAENEIGDLPANMWRKERIAAPSAVWEIILDHIKYWVRILESPMIAVMPLEDRGKAALGHLAAVYFRIPPPRIGATLGLRVNLDQWKSTMELLWSNLDDDAPRAGVIIRPMGVEQLGWTLTEGEKVDTGFLPLEHDKLVALVAGWINRFPSLLEFFQAFWVNYPHGRNSAPVYAPEPPFTLQDPPFPWLIDNLKQMQAACLLCRTPGIREMASETMLVDIEHHQRRLQRKEQKLAEKAAQRQETMERLARERAARERAKTQTHKPVAHPSTTPATAPVTVPARARPAEPLAELPVRIELPPLELQDTTFPISSLENYRLRERAALLWVSNQSDNLLCLPHCRIQHLEYQLRTALRVLGPLRGRALLSDEVGLGKTIEAGLVIKELLTRGMVKRFLVLTVPSLVDQWQEELQEKFGLETVTTNEEASKRDPAVFWGSPGIVASLHTLKQPAHLEVARRMQMDILVVDEAHYLRNRDSLAWQAVNSLKRQFLLLLTATPVQNSLEELYNLVTLLQPGQLPSPKEFRSRFVDPKRPRQPREPEELRRLLGQIMIRNTRANSGIALPPRRAETVLFEPGVEEAGFWRTWETEFRASLNNLPPGQASLWGRLLLQAAGSSPAAWRAALRKFPDQARAAAWREQSPLVASWQGKCQLIPPLTHVEGGVVIFTQFLETQAALAEFLRSQRIETFVINGATPAEARQPITEEFQKKAGALLLTHSGTEGRNLQFSHRLVNFDLPWNPMELEQRIGRLHRLGQRHPVRIYNFVQAGTLQAHLLEILQEKLNLFELVVGETGLVLGERFSSDEFAEEVFRRWRENEGKVAEAMTGLGNELAEARAGYNEVKTLDETLFAKDYESI